MAPIVGGSAKGGVQPRMRLRAACLVVMLATPLAGAAAHGPRVVTLHLPAPGVSETPLRVRVIVPAHCAAPRPACDTLYINDGQDTGAVGLVETVTRLDTHGHIRAPVIVAVDMPTDRLGAYGFSDRGNARSVKAPTRYGDVGARAHAYSEWLVHTLVPRVEARFAVRAMPRSRAILGWSLGGANAFNVAWQYPDVFGRAGAFSPSFWLATDNRDAASVQRTRIAHAMLARAAPRELHLFLAVGTDEEHDDRDGDGTNDALDDVRELVDGTPASTGLRQLGYRITGDGALQPGHGDIALYVLPGGRHDQPSWARMLPAFLRWAYGRDAKQ